MRINKYLAQKGLATRRGADTLIQEGKITINGRKALLGDKVEERDLVEVRASHKQKAYSYYAYHKPRGIMTHSAQDGEDDINGITIEVPELRGTFPIGRLDKDSSGLMLLTNDGRVTDRMLNPVHEHEKEYVVRTKQPLRSSFKEYMEAGVDIEGYRTKPCTVKILGGKTFRITLTEGKKHQIRRMVSAMHNEVDTLERVRVLNIALDSLSSGAFRKIEGAELKTFLKTIGL